jgi:D-alanyl-lipoteichoic acid acyltransferase DltB (MBOAT superfamily)
MLFNTLEYFLFFSFVLAVSWLIAGWSRFRTYFLIAASFYFYTSNNSWLVFLLITTTTIDYFASLLMARTKDKRVRKLLLGASVASNLGMLGYFKYYNFVGGSFAYLSTWLGVHFDWVDANILLPVGISFYTFEALSYTIDVYRGKIKAETDYSRLAFLVSFFPHLIAGPIVRAADFFPQIGRPPRMSIANLELAVYLLAIGLFKKIVLADGLAPFADDAFRRPHEIGSLATWIGVYAFTFQIYFDFSGYTDIALGSAKLLGFELPPNFNRPYAATSVTDFWRRWHMSLSTWLRDYLYISLGGNRMKTQWGVYRNLMLTMVLGGLWHGAAWHFVIWGALHGAWLSAERMWEGLSKLPWDSRIGVAVRTIAVFHGVTALWLVFRAGSMTEIWNVMSTMVSCAPSRISVGMVAACAIMIWAWVAQVITERVDLKTRFLMLPIPLKVVPYLTYAALVFILNSETPKTFIYFKF